MSTKDSSNQVEDTLFTLVMSESMAFCTIEESVLEHGMFEMTGSLVK